MNANKLETLWHISDISQEELIKNIGLYEPILINTYSNEINNMGDNPRLEISEDVKALYELIEFKTPCLLPCSHCKRENPFIKKKNLNQNRTPSKISLSNDDDDIEKYMVDKSPSSYTLFSNFIMLIANENFNKKDEACRTCKDVISSALKFFSVGLECTYNSNHNIQCFFSIEPFEIDEKTKKMGEEYNKENILAGIESKDEIIITPEVEEALKLYDLAQYTLVLRKVGQFPSMADMQFFELKKYNKLLKNYYGELTRAIGLNASGIGIGSFVYLRRIFEHICDDIHKECSLLDGWKEEEYRGKKFNDKIEYLESFGKIIIPSELGQIRNKIYGVLSEGIHEYSEDECLEMFPHILLAIELILDEQLNRILRQKKIKKMTSALVSAK